MSKCEMKRISKSTLVVIMLLFSMFSVSKAEPFRISLITCSRGGDLSSAFGHSAIRVVDSVNNRDIVFNYGTFDLYDDYFMLRFLHGDLDYFLSISHFESFCRSYKEDGRGITEQELILSEPQKFRLYEALLENARPKNRVYRYDFLVDNCATRIRDLFIPGDEFSFESKMTDLTWRSELRRCIADNRWLTLGIDLLLGDKVDEKISTYQQMFLPDRLAEHFDNIKNISLHTTVLDEPTEIISAQETSKVGNWVNRIFQPFVIFLLLYLSIIVIGLRCRWGKRYIDVFSFVFYILLGVGSLILVYLWFFTNHVWTVNNWNLIWMNPLYLIIPFIREGKLKRRLIYLTALASAGMVVFSWLIPQSFNSTVIIIVLIQVSLAAVKLGKVNLSK